MAKMTEYIVVKLKEGYCASQLVREAPFLMNVRSNGHEGVQRLPGNAGLMFLSNVPHNNDLLEFSKSLLLFVFNTIEG